MSRKKMRFDPLTIRTTFQRQKTFLAAFSEAYGKFSQAISEIDDGISILADLDPNLRSTEVLLVFLFGINGVNCMKSAVRLVPKEIPHSERIRYIKNILSAVKTDEITENDVSILIKTMDLHPNFDINNVLCNLSESSGTAYTQFLAPPTSLCLNDCCPRFGDPEALYQHHPPTTVSIFTLEGPKPGTKICLKCKECSTIYNYRSYGKKKSGGEQFYSEDKEFIEVSDVTYCDRRMLQMYSLLRYVSALEDIYISFSIIRI